MNISAKPVPSGHSTFVHDAQIDPTSRYLVTCSSDRCVKLFGRTPQHLLEEVGEPWKLLSTVSDHSGTVQKVAWTHPANGPTLATSSTDRTIVLYRVENDTLSRQMRIPVQTNDAISDISFAPRQFGSLLGVACLDGALRVIDVMNRRTLYRFYVDDLAPTFSPEDERSAAVALSWCQSITEPYMTCAVGTVKGNVVVHAYDPTSKKAQRVVLEEEDASGNRKPVTLSHNSSITSIAWAPSVGRRYQLLAVCSKTKLQVVYIQKKAAPASKPTPPPTARSTPSKPGGPNLPSVITYTVKAVTIAASAVPVERVSWNTSATMLGSVGDDQQVRLWQRVPGGADGADDTWELF